ncbi:5425_t:CDS:2, partial [Acaulospora colombiana]
GFTASEVDGGRWRREANSANWSNTIGFEDNFRDVHNNRILELAMIYLSPLDSPGQDCGPPDDTEHGLVPDHSMDVEKGQSQRNKEVLSIIEDNQNFGKDGALQLDLGREAALSPSLREVLIANFLGDSHPNPLRVVVSLLVPYASLVMLMNSAIEISRSLEPDLGILSGQRYQIDIQPLNNMASPSVSGNNLPKYQNGITGNSTKPIHQI